MDLSLSARILLSSMKNGTKVLVRATTGEATYSSPGHFETDCTHALKELKIHGLVKIEKVDRAAGWVWYIPKDNGEGTA